MRTLLFVLLFSSGLAVFAQTTPKKTSEIIQPKTGQTQPTQANQAKVVPFPRSWQGRWKGNLSIYTVPNRLQRVPMMIEIRPTSDTARYAFNITYGTDTVKGRRAYDLIVINAQRGIYQIDEKNSIKMEGFFVAGRLISEFTLGGNRLISSYEKRGETLTFEVIAGRDAYVSTSGGGKRETPPAAATTSTTAKPAPSQYPVVQTFPVGSWQRAVLIKDGYKPVGLTPASTPPQTKSKK
ncbi:MAG: hypothetical protein LH606_04065 [Cytophagaceae bacterium]|nr:hypothetical protein [Cytophagaceae bacterium]